MKITRFGTIGLALSIGLLAAWIPAAMGRELGSAGDAGIGLAVMQPTGVTGKLWLSNDGALDGMLGYHFNGNFDFHADYLLHSFSLFHISGGRLPVYVGAGGRVLAGDDTQFGLRVPFGMSALFASQPIEVFGEVAPVIEVAPNIDLDVDFLAGVRVYFGYVK